MFQVHKTVFVSYRRSQPDFARCVYLDLRLHRFSAFFDKKSTGSGLFGPAIIRGIVSRAHFLPILTPSGVDRCSDPDDWMRHEIETALRTKRNVVPIVPEPEDADEFNFASVMKRVSQLPVAALGNYNGVPFHVDYFDECMMRLRKDFLGVPVDVEIPVQEDATQEQSPEQESEADFVPAVTKDNLRALIFFERGYVAADLEKKQHFFSEAIRLRPDFAEAWESRALVREAIGDQDGAWDDRLHLHDLKIRNPEAILEERSLQPEDVVQSRNEAELRDSPELEVADILERGGRFNPGGGSNPGGGFAS